MQQTIRNRINALYKRKFLFGLVTTAALLLLLLPVRAIAQFGLDPCCAIISAGLNSISGLLKGVVAQPLGQIQQLRQQALNFEQQVVYPAAAINQARNLAGQFQGQFTQMRQLFQVSVQSATLADPQRLEQSILSRSVGAIPNISASYTAVYGPVMASTNASPALRDVVDATDAEAQAALKKAVEIDALADLELQAAEQMNQQLQAAAPGSAPLLEAQAAAWVVRANAYTQTAMAELVRVRSIDLADRSAQLKFSTGHAATLRTNTNQLLGTPR
jgi:hypothetical protein